MALDVFEILGVIGKFPNQELLTTETYKNLETKMLMSQGSRAEKDKFIVLKDGKEIETTFGRYIRRHLEISVEEISDKTLSLLSGIVLEKIMGKNKNIKVITGEKIWEAYKDKSFPSSCMTRGQAIPAIFYAKQPNISMITFSEGRARARALLITTDQGNVVRDRIYSYQNYAGSAIESWAKENKCYSKDDKEIREDTVTVLKTPPFPYMDTWRFGEALGKGKLLLRHVDTSAFQAVNSHYCLNRQTGGILRIGRPSRTLTTKCPNCKRRVSCNRFYYTDINNKVCLRCYANSKITCEKCWKPYSEEYGEKCFCE